MGAVFSSKDMTEVMGAAEVYPPTPKMPIRKVSDQWDPRSPTIGIDRTPIQVEKTPVPMQDPRSPSYDIARTPIFGKISQSSQESPLARRHSPLIDTPAETRPDLAPSPLAEEDDTDPLGALEELRLDPDAEEDESFTSLNRSASEPDLSPRDDQQLLLATPDKLSQSYKEPSFLRKRQMKLSSTSSTSTTESESEGKETARLTPKSTPDGVKRSPLSTLNTRNVDVNSPRFIMQRKQMTKLGLRKPQSPAMGMKVVTKSPGRYHIYTDEKENQM